MKKIRAFLLLVVILLIVLTGIFLKPLVKSLSEFLSKTETVTGNTLIVEGWIPYNYLSRAVDVFHNGNYSYVLTTGLRSTTKFYNVYTDGYLVFYTGSAHNESEKPGLHNISVIASSELGGADAAHFDFWVNDSIKGNFFAEKHKKVFTVKWRGRISDVDSVMIQFDNDLIDEAGDRNLFVKEVTIDNSITIPFLRHSVYQIGKFGSGPRIINNMNSNAELTRKRLITLGMDSTRIIALPGNKVRINRTLTSALAVRDWIKKADVTITGINIVSIGDHSRRTWMTFSKVIDGSARVGIIALDYDRSQPERIRALKALREGIAYLYYLVILIPY